MFRSHLAIYTDVLPTLFGGAMPYDFGFCYCATSVIICMATRGPCQVNINIGHFRHWNKELILSFCESPTQNGPSFFTVFLLSKYMTNGKATLTGNIELNA